MSHTPRMRPGSDAFGGFEPGSTAELVPAEIVRSMTARVNPIALGAALGIVFGFLVCGATNLLILKGGAQVGTHLSLLSNYWPGYEVTVTGSLIGALYGVATGFFLGFMTAWLRNAFLGLYLGAVKLWANLSRTYFLDRLQ